MRRARTARQRNVYAITSFIFGMDNDTTGVAERKLSRFAPGRRGCRIFGLLTPLPALLFTNGSRSLAASHAKHWQEFIPFAMAHTPLKMTITEAHAEVKYG